MSMASLKDLLTDQLKDIYNAEHQLLKALPKMAKRASSDELREAFQGHLEETRGQIERLDQAAEHMGIALRGKKCKAMEGLIEEGKEVLEEDGPEGVIDSALIAAAQRVEHYEISAYGSARALAEKLELQDIVTLLQASLEEESACDEKLTQLSENTILPAALQNEQSGDSDDEVDQRSGGATGRAPRSRKVTQSATAGVPSRSGSNNNRMAASPRSSDSSSARTGGRASSTRR